MTSVPNSNFKFQQHLLTLIPQAQRVHLQQYEINKGYMSENDKRTHIMFDPRWRETPRKVNLHIVAPHFSLMLQQLSTRRKVP